MQNTKKGSALILIVVVILIIIMVALFVNQKNASSVDINVSKSDPRSVRASQSANVYEATNHSDENTSIESKNTQEDEETIDELEQLLNELDDIDFGTL